MMSDGDLLQLIKRDDTAAFESIYDKYWQALYLKACQRVDKDEAKDMVQEVMITLWRRRNDIRVMQEGDLGRYLFTAIRYRVISHYAFSAAEIKKADFFDTFDDYITTDTLETKELKARIETEIGRLPARMQQIFRLSREDDYTIADIAKTLNISEQTVKNQLTDALKRLRTSLKASSTSDWTLVVIYLFSQLHQQQ
ncbi:MULTISPECIES: RNA polymerase sigma factor [Chitinophaga]|uniref:RNA polymerase sigma factor n=1 Tax=Chitinophaga TaxID=79328 RepID=UPI000DBA7031|nr:sigma-70 family RNA polymerase sigma factor [Chitinophaga ginsengisegetis]MDR6570516.1 RNA polymerase sigma-70 factor (ECF subfamily) [Chitinophaga ginsengisegetis]MDR6650250.1 RNA polymerase sigma-70 factor (ECF subfamily) [Chitinophaga ginsengisegetis]MDR6656631.1 RNA polymerase sigma-70 factor (ECF subfamily) [Chitinophaga ginsengisegetis]